MMVSAGRTARRGPLEDGTRIERRAWLTLAVTSLVGFMVSLEITIIALALPELRAAFPDASEATIAWVITAYNIGVASLLLVSGWLADRVGRKRIFLIGLTVFGAGSLMAGMAVSAPMLVGARVLQSIGGSMQFPAGIALLLPAFPVARRQMAIGVWGAMGGLAAAAGPSVGALIVDAFGWRAIFLINVPVAICAVVFGRRWLIEGRGEQTTDRVDLISVPMASIGVAALVLVIVEGETWGWTSARIIAAGIVCAVLITAFVIRSRRHPAPLFDLGLFRLRTFALGNVGTVVFACAFFGYWVLLPSFIQAAWGWSVLQTGFAIAAGPLLSTILAPPMGRLADRIGNGPILAVGGVAGVIGMGLHLAWTTTEPDYVTGILVPALFVGVAAGCSFAMLVGATIRDVPPRQFGMGGAGRTTVFQLGVALGIAIAVALVGRPSSPQAALDAVQRVWWLSLGLFAVQALLFGLAFPRPTPAVVTPVRASARP